jgi:hypothetical protein
LTSDHSSDFDLAESLPEPEDPALDDIAGSSFVCCFDVITLFAKEASSLKRIAVQPGLGGGLNELRSYWKVLGYEDWCDGGITTVYS